jgi:hypothetical protein
MKQTILLFATLFLASVAFGQKASNYAELLKTQLKGDKTEMVSKLLGVKIDPGSDFGKLYGEFQDKLLANGEERFKLVNDYLNHSNNITPDFAKNLIDQTLKVDGDRTKILSKYSKKLGKFLSPQNTLALLQFENKLKSLTDAKLAELIPFANQ